MKKIKLILGFIALILMIISIYMLFSDQEQFMNIVVSVILLILIMCIIMWLNNFGYGIIILFVLSMLFIYFMLIMSCL